MKKLTIGVLALQGSFAEHMDMLDRIGVQAGKSACRKTWKGWMD